MIHSGSKVPSNTILSCDVCIAGAGPAGIAIALELAKGPLRTVLLESGGNRETADARALNQGYCSPQESHEPLEENRRRVFGGASSVWGGRCVPLDAIDFEHRHWVPYSGWPFSKAHLEPYYERALKLCEAGANTFSSRDAFPQKQHEMIEGFDDASVISDHLERWSPPTNFGKKYGSPLERSSNTTVILNATLVHIQAPEKSGLIRRVHVKSAVGHSFMVEARAFVLALGTLENTRLLLVSNRGTARGFGNQSNALGRFYMSHLFGSMVPVTLRDPHRGFVYDFERDSEGVYCRRRFWITPEAQRGKNILNGVSFFFRPGLGESVHASAIVSLTMIVKALLESRRRPLKSASFLLNHIRKHGQIVLKDAHHLPADVSLVIKHRFFAKRRLPAVLPPVRDNFFYLCFQTEHAPNPQSCVRLSGEQDHLGVPKLDVSIKFSEMDIETVKCLHKSIELRLNETQLGELRYDEGALVDRLRSTLFRFNSSGHSLGTTRMSRYPEDGVVNPHCQVHDVPNLFIAGGSVFPTSGHANPTLTVVALALRLADHLAERYR